MILRSQVRVVPATGLDLRAPARARSRDRRGSEITPDPPASDERDGPNAVVYVPPTVMTAEDVVEIVGWLAASGVDVWLDGGWGVDALIGEQTREHEDLDLIVRDAHEAVMREVLASHGFAEQHDSVPQNFVLADGGGREVDVHPVTFDDVGDGHLRTYDGEPFGHPAAAFAAVGSIAGESFACLSPEAQMSNHSWGYTPDDTDVRDMRLLHERLGTPLLPPFSGPSPPIP